MDMLFGLLLFAAWAVSMIWIGMLGRELWEDICRK